MQTGLKLSEAEEERSLEIHNKSIFINAIDCTVPKRFDSEYLSELKQGGITAQSQIVTGSEIDNFHDAIRKLCLWFKKFEKIGYDKILLGTTGEDVERGKREGKVTIYLNIHTSEIEGDLALLSIFHKIGVRMVQFTHNERNLFGDGSEEKSDCGMSKLGIEAIAEMNKLGVLTDLSHAGRRTTLEGVEISKDPVVYTHAGASSLCDHFRNKTDEEIKALSEKDGVMGIIGWYDLIGGTSINDYLNHIDYVSDLVGVDHVGIGLDLTSPRQTAEDFEFFYNVGAREIRVVSQEHKSVENLHAIGPSNVQVITRGLVSRGYSNKEIEKILGLNFLRVFKKVWRK